MAFGTRFSQRALVRVVELVAGIAGGLELALEDIPDMTRFAGNLRVQASKRKLGIFAVIELQLDPADRTVALLAFSPIAPSMLVVILVTGEASLALRIILEIAAVAGSTTNTLMFTDERKVGLRVVVEIRFFPINRGVTGVTLITMTTKVNVIQTVTGDAGCRRVLVALADMAKIAANFLVFPQQGEIGLAMIEMRLVPVVFVVAGSTLLSKASLVRLFILVASDTLRRRLAVLFSRFMAIRASDLYVATDERKLGHVMVECVRIEPDDIGISTLVLGVTMLALDNAQIGDCAMKPPLSGDILVDFLMA